MNPDTTDLQQRMSRVVPVDMFNDPDFKEVLKEKARRTAPSESSITGSESSLPVASESSSHSQPHRRSSKKQTHKSTADRERQARLFNAARNPARIIDPYDPDMIPQIERRVHDRRRRREEASRIYRPDPADEQAQAQQDPTTALANSLGLPPWMTWKMYLAIAFAVFVLIILLKRSLMVRKLGISYAFAAELPFLSSIMSGLSGVPAQQMVGEIRQFDAGIHPVLRPAQLPPAPALPPASTGKAAPPATAPAQAPVETAPDGEEKAAAPDGEKDKAAPAQPPKDPRKETIEMLVDEAQYYAMDARGEVEHPEQEEEEYDEEEGEGYEEGEDEEYYDDEEEEEERPRQRKKLPEVRKKQQAQSKLPRRKPPVVKKVGSRSTTTPEFPSPPAPKVVKPAVPASAAPLANNIQQVNFATQQSQQQQEAIPGVSRGRAAREKAAQAESAVTQEEVIPGVTRGAAARAKAASAPPEVVDTKVDKSAAAVAKAKKNRIIEMGDVD